MDYPAILNPTRPITRHTTASPIWCSEFRRGSAYTNWRPEGTQDWLLIMTLAGAGRIEIGDRSIRLNVGDVVLFSPGAAQDYSTDPEAGRWHLRWAHFLPRPHWLPWMIWPKVGRKVGMRHFPDLIDGPIEAASRRMLTSERLGGAGAQDLAMNALEETLLWMSRSSGATDTPQLDPRIQQAALHLAAHPEAPFRLEELAARCALSPSRFSHLFKAELGTTPQRFSEHLRLELARHLLAQTNLTIAAIAAEVGFEDPLYFSRRFRRAYRHAPSAERG